MRSEKMSVASVMKPMLQNKMAGMPKAEAKAKIQTMKPAIKSKSVTRRTAIMKKGKAKGMSKTTIKAKVSAKKKPAMI